MSADERQITVSVIPLIITAFLPLFLTVLMSLQYGKIRLRAIKSEKQDISLRPSIKMLFAPVPSMGKMLFMLYAGKRKTARTPKKKRQKGKIKAFIVTREEKPL